MMVPFSESQLDRDSRAVWILNHPGFNTLDILISRTRRRRVHVSKYFAHSKNQARDDLHRLKIRVLKKRPTELDQLFVGPDTTDVGHEDDERRPVDSFVFRPEMTQRIRHFSGQALERSSVSLCFGEKDFE
ncbi:MAG: hypothetical protein JNG84_13790 [Archangium sp.]|nr:hypothetical protein [Archangium sp.]